MRNQCTPRLSSLGSLNSHIFAQTFISSPDAVYGQPTIPARRKTLFHIRLVQIASGSPRIYAGGGAL
jgi:hypothetical protein